MFRNVWKMVLCGRRYTLASFSEDTFHFRGRRSTLDVSIFILHGRHSTLEESCCLFFASKFITSKSMFRARPPSIFIASHKIHACHGIWSLSPLDTALTLQFAHKKTRRKTSILKLQTSFETTLLTPHSTLSTPHSTLYTLHSTLCTLHSTLYTLHSTLHTSHFILCNLHSSLHTLHFPLHTPHSTLYTLHCTLYTLHFALYTLHSTLHTLHCALLTPHFTVRTLHFTLYTSLHTLHSTLFPIRQSTVHWYGNGEKCRLFT